ncbi:molybdopterin synthase small subunit MoaD [Gordonia effusa NBRC 100432]|uniref:Molybdopterin synthase small subunit MoaD n=1 Tax=Gordonia effusa NBRC 100432 TaxID=1077974 RepID=H0QYX1_9ACTN|nr:MoaD/ThiS family protein [Gordonia effusa]GAB18022.1 molybdopterin synthase small subunit MoaD [Gordonia effusa NBRC 100432]
MADESTATPRPIPINVRYFAAIADATGCRTETLDVASATVGGLRTAIGDRHGSRAGDLAQLCSVLSGDEMLRDADAAVGGEVDLLPPFAGG